MENISIDKRAALEIIMDDEAIIIDVRTPEELEDVPPITDEVYNIPFNNEFINILEEEELDKDTKILVYCTHGIRSKKAVILMRDKGFKNAYTLDGGLEAILTSDGCWE